MDTIPQDSIPRKQCTTCHEFLPATPAYFHRARKGKYGLHAECKRCKGCDKTFGYIPKECKEGEKECLGCHEIWPATEEYFHKSPQGKMGLRSRCKKCLGKGTTFGKTKEIRTDEKQCTQCLYWFPKNADFFQVNRSLKDGLTSRCKQCQNEFRKTYHASKTQAVKERQKRRMHRYYESRQEHARRIGREYYAAHQEHARQDKRRYRREHYDELHQPEVLEQRRLYAQEWRKRPERLGRRRELSRIHSHNRRARKKAIPGTHTPEQIKEQLKRQRYRCYYAACGHAKFKKEKGEYVYEIEHTYPLSRVVGTDIPANDMSYLVLACPDCNDRKGRKFPWEWPEGGRLM